MSSTATVRGKAASGADKPANQTPVIPVNGKRGIDILHDPTINKATAYTEAERQALGLVGAYVPAAAYLPER